MHCATNRMGMTFNMNKYRRNNRIHYKRGCPAGKKHHREQVRNTPLPYKHLAKARIAGSTW